MLSGMARPEPTPTHAPRHDRTIPQEWGGDTRREHATWDRLFARQAAIFGPLHAALADAPDIEIEAILPGDRVHARGTRAYARGGHAGA